MLRCSDSHQVGGCIRVKHTFHLILFAVFPQPVGQLVINLQRGLKAQMCFTYHPWLSATFEDSLGFIKKIKETEAFFFFLAINVSSHYK